MVDQLVAGGEGLGRWEGIPIFVPRSAPGDRLRVRIVDRKPDWGRGEIVEILEPGPGRRPPPCPHFEACGGCDLQHLEDARQLELKVLAFGDTLRRIGKIQETPEMRVVSGPAWGYRLRCGLRTGQTERGPRVGYLGRRSHDLVPIDVCPILAPELERVAQRLPRALGEEAPTRIDLALGDDEWTTAPLVEGLPSGEVSMRVGDFRLSFDARCFFQANRPLLEELVSAALGSETGERAADLYCGVGLFTLPLARRYGDVVAVEADRIATRYCRANVKDNGAEGVRVETRSVEDWANGMPEGLDRVLVDPPRAGLAPRVRRLLMERPPKLLTYVSCDPATFSRDLRQLLRRFELESLTLLDLFPQTGHLEAVAQLRIREREPTIDAESQTEGRDPR